MKRKEFITTMLLLFCMSLIYILCSCQKTTALQPQEAVIIGNAANLENGGRFFLYKDIIYGPLNEQCALSATNTLKQQTNVIYSGEAYNVIGTEDGSIFFLNQEGNLIAIKNKQESCLVEGPVAYFQIRNDTLFYLCIATGNGQYSATLNEMSLDGESPKVIYSYYNNEQHATGSFALSEKEIFLPVGLTDILKVDLATKNATSIVSHNMHVENLGMIRNVVYQDGFLYFLGQQFKSEFDRPTYLFRLNLTADTVEKLTNENTTKFTMDLHYIYYATVNEQGAKIIQANIDGSHMQLLKTDSYPSSMEIIGNTLYCNEGTGAICKFTPIEILLEDKGTAACYRTL